MTLIDGKSFDEERALYGLRDAIVANCVFAGPMDGESVLKEASDIKVENCKFSLRYPLWHVRKFEMVNSSLDEYTRAPIWYSQDGTIIGCDIDSIKAVRECKDITLTDCRVKSPEFGWMSEDIKLSGVEIESEYIFLKSNNVRLDNVNMKGKYSFQYMNGLHIVDSLLDTKDAFWHSENVTVENSVIKGEYLAWFSKNLTLINCKIIGTQPFCYCDNLRLINCTMDETDLAFEYSDVDADVRGHIVSVKNPKCGTIIADSVGEILFEDAVMACEGRVVIRENTDEKV